jgi:hypothetical protein
VDPDTALAGYVETDFQSAPADSNSIESNSYTPRLRQAYATFDRSDLGLHLLGGQTYTLLTLFNHDMTPRQEDIPLTIDGQYVVGFTWDPEPAVQGGPGSRQGRVRRLLIGKPADASLQRAERAAGADDRQQPRRKSPQPAGPIFDGYSAGHGGEDRRRARLGPLRWRIL